MWLRLGREAAEETWFDLGVVEGRFCGLGRESGLLVLGYIGFTFKYVEGLG